MRTVTDNTLTQDANSRTIALCNSLGRHLRLRGDHADAVRYLRQALNAAVTLFGEEDPGLARDLNDLGWALLGFGDLAPARDCFEAALPRWQQLGDDANYAATLDNLGQVSIGEGNLGEAEQRFTSALAIREEVLEECDPRIAVTLTNLGDICKKRHDLSDALEYYDRALAIRLKALGASHPTTALTLLRQADVLVLTRDLRGAERALDGAVNAYIATLGDRDPRTVDTFARLALVVLTRGDSERAVDLLARVEVLRDQMNESPTPVGVDVLNTVGFIKWSSGDFAAACGWYLDALRACQGIRKDGDFEAVVLNNLGMVWEWLDQPDVARDAYEQAHAVLERSQRSATELAARIANNYGGMLTVAGELAAARGQLERAYAERLRLLGEGRRRDGFDAREARPIEQRGGTTARGGGGDR